MDLNAMSLKDLKDLQGQVAKAINSYEDRKKRDAISALEEQAKAMGFSLSELTGVPKMRKRTSPKAKYANPANASETWSGRGRQPRWYAAALKGGKSPSDLSL
jgi:DNA-binding protein H-NS